MGFGRAQRHLSHRGGRGGRRSERERKRGLDIDTDRRSIGEKGKGEDENGQEERESTAFSVGSHSASAVASRKNPGVDRVLNSLPSRNE